MLTRAGVAKRLGRSVAAVRRMEGVELHPWVDERGVHRFDAAEVEHVKAKDTEQTAPTPVLAPDAEALLTEAISAANQQISELQERLSAAEASLTTAPSWPGA